MDTTQARGHIASDVPGRLRVRLRHPRPAERHMRRVRVHLSQQSGVSTVVTNSTTGSITVTYNRHERSAEDVLAMLRDVGVIAERTAEALGEPGPHMGPSTTAEGIQAALNDLDVRISQVSGRRVDLKLLFPLGLGALGFRQLLVAGLGIQQVPAYMLLWYAFDAFWKLHHQHSLLAEGRGREAEEPKKGTPEAQG